MISLAEIIQIVLYAVVLFLLTPPFGKFMAQVFEGKRTFLLPVFGPLERFIFRLSGIDAEKESDWKQYTFALLAFNGAGFLVVFLLQFFQSSLPLNPQQLPDVSWHLAFNTAVSFMTNTNWQSYAGEVTLSYFVQMMGLTVQNFVSAATGIAVMLCLIRGIARKTTSDVGNFWADHGPLDGLRAASAVDIVHDRLGERRNSADILILSDSVDARGSAADHSAWTGGIADRDQADRFERRRFLQYEQFISA
jgi:hypothetical protein